MGLFKRFSGMKGSLGARASLLGMNGYYFFDGEAIKDELDEASAKVLGRFGAMVRIVARRSIRKRKRISNPGEPPTSRRGNLKKGILYAYDKETASVVVGPLRTPGGSNAPSILEYGGQVSGTPGYGSPGAFLDHGYGPIRIGLPTGKSSRRTRSRATGGNIWVTRASIETYAQAQRASRLFIDYGLPGSEKAYAGTRTVAARPYMQPALDTSLPKLPEMWRDSIR